MIGSGPRELSDAQLLDVVWAGDTGAFSALYERHVAAARRLASQLAGSPGQVDDMVAETFAQMLDVARRGFGVSNAIRPYVLASLRQVYYERYDQFHGGKEQMPDPGRDMDARSLAGVENTLMARAYLSLPGSQQAVLWHTEVENEAPADIAPLLGVAGDDVASLRRSAVEDLRDSYLLMYALDATRPDCRPVAELLGTFIRGDLPAGQAEMVSDHLADCRECRTAFEELAEVKAALRRVVGPLVLGSDAARYLDGVSGELASGPALAAPGTWPAAPAPEETAAVWYGSSEDPGHADALPVAAATTAAAGNTRWAGPARPGDTEADAPPARQRLGLLPSAPRTMTAAAALVTLAVAVIVLAFSLTGLSTTSASGGVRPQMLAPSSSAGSQSSTSSATGSPAPSPGRPPTLSSASGRPASSPMPSHSSSSPTTPESPSAPGSVQLAASIDVTAPSNPFAPSGVTFQVDDTGSAASGPLNATITLPAATELVSDSVTSGGWNCQASGSGAACTHSPLSPGQDAAASFSFTTGCGQVSIVATSGSATATAVHDIPC
jgi:DNA-directed RNA polymerase specialized sigma24 family protein